jgi:outer membrane lipoprotein-sorting protein
LPGFASTGSGLFGEGLASYVIEVRDAASGELVQAVWVDRATYLLQRIVYFEDEQRARALEVENMRINQGLTVDEVLVTPSASVTVRG